MKIDSHQHYWKISRTDYGWLKPSSGKLWAYFMPDQLRPHLEQFGIQKTVVVQAAPTAAETEFLLDIAAHEDTLAGVVGWLDMDSPGFEAEWNRFRRNPKFVGLRPMIQDLPSEWIMREQVVQNMQLAAQAGFAIDLQANPRHLPYILQLLERVPDLCAVVDHLATPHFAKGELEPWGTQMTQTAAYPNLMCKLSGLVYRRDDNWSAASVRPFAHLVIRAFGKQRVMFGSDWPVCLMWATYPQVVELFESCLDAGWTDDEKADAYGRNAQRFYRLPVTET